MFSCRFILAIIGWRTYTVSCLKVLFASLQIVLLFTSSKLYNSLPHVGILLKCPKELVARHWINFRVFTRAYQRALIWSLHNSIILTENLTATYQSYFNILSYLFLFVFMVSIFNFSLLNLLELDIIFFGILLNWIRTHLKISARQRLESTVPIFLLLWSCFNVFTYLESPFIYDENL